MTEKKSVVVCGGGFIGDLGYGRGGDSEAMVVRFRELWV